MKYLLLITIIFSHLVFANPIIDEPYHPDHEIFKILLDKIKEFKNPKKAAKYLKKAEKLGNEGGHMLLVLLLDESEETKKIKCKSNFSKKS